MVQRWLSFLLLTLLLSLSGVISVTFTLVNLCNYTLWPAAYTTGGNQTLSTTGFVLNSGESSTITVPAGWGGHLWSRTECSLNRTTGDFSCVTGDCFTGRLACDGMKRTPPATRVEMTLNGDNNQDNYAISLIDGFNIPMAIIPLRGNCSRSGCRAHVNAVCPSGLKVTKWKERLVVAVACRSVNTCLEDCSYVHAVNILRKACPQARILADDNENTYSCASDTDYYITFCPPLTSESNNTSLRWLNKGVSVGVSLTAGNGTTRWLSPSGDFAFGFYQLPNGLFLLAIWYHRITNETTIWYANGDNPAPKGSRLELNGSQGLVLTSPQGSVLWRSYFKSTIT